MSCQQQATTNRVPVPWKVADLKPYPRQAALFRDLNGVELGELAQDIKANGLRSPPEVLPDGTIVNGHQRVRAFRLLGLAEIPVVVRDDWARQGPADVEKHFIEDNLNRRHLDKLELARCCQRLVE